jgi:4-amino-4-deoxy-L-arabinose transferase-like glycosyltransferase
MRARAASGPLWESGFAVATLTVGLVLVRLWAAATIGLAPDEMYYWVWSRNLALSYFDHPPAVAYLIRLSTLIGGDGPFGVRWLAVVLSGLLSIGVYRLAGQVYGDRRAAFAAAALVQSTLFVGFGSIFVTPDTPLVAFWLVALLAAAHLRRSGSGASWLAIGAATGLAFLSKYTALLLGCGLLAWVIVVPEMRSWLRSPWPYAGGLVTLVLTLPVLTWNARHDWASFGKQFGRAVPHSFDPTYLPEFLAGQIVLLSPFVALLVACGFIRALREIVVGDAAGSALLVCTTLPLLLYFLYHALFARVEGNWTAPLLPALIVLAAAVTRFAPPAAAGMRRAVEIAARWAVPTGVTLALLLVAHAEFRLIALARDPIAQTAGWRDLVRETERLAEGRAGALAGVSYQVTSALRYFGGSSLPKLQLTERLRYVMEPAPDWATIRALPVLILAEPREACRALVGAERAFARVELVGTLDRRWNGAPVESYLALSASEPRLPGPPDLTVARNDRSIDCSRLRELRRVEGG